jgi:phosphoserine aminotransferase
MSGEECAAASTIAASPGVHAGVLDVLEHAADHGGLAVADAVHVQLDRVLEELVDQHGLARHDVEDLRG